MTQQITFFDVSFTIRYKDAFASVLQFACLVTAQVCRSCFVLLYFQNRKRDYSVYLHPLCVAEFDR